MQIPHATYRIQFHQDFTFDNARQITGYLHQLGMGTLYASPIFKAASGSNHGYDVADPNQINPEAGTKKELLALFDALTERGMTWLQDIVPNHMVFSSENALLMDVLEKGYASAYYKHFDIEWNHPSESLKRRVLVPFLGSPYSETLKTGELKFQYTDGGFSITYYQLSLPLRIESYSVLFQTTGAEPDELAPITNELVQTFTEIAAQKGAERVAAIERTKDAIWQAYTTNEVFRQTVDRQVAVLNGDPTRMHQILSGQHFRLAFWRMANREINYRRFFNINDLISVRVEDPDVLTQTHQFIFELLARPVFSGVRIDHIDGLSDPTTYLELLRERAPDAYIVAEKILEPGETLPSIWPIQGTSGYDFMNQVNNLFCDHANRAPFRAIYQQFTGLKFDFDDLLYEKKKFILDRLFVGDLERLFQLFRKLASLLPEGADVTGQDLRATLRVLLACFPVYRTYVRSAMVSEADRTFLGDAFRHARKRLPEPTIAWEFVRKILWMELPDYASAYDRTNWMQAVTKFQQVTGPLMAKGLEDTTFYIFNQFISLNEVGGHPDGFGISVDEFHRHQQFQQQYWPHNLNASSTHDTKRGEDVRARLNVLSEIPDAWETQVQRWRTVNEPVKPRVKKERYPDANEEYFLYQTLVGAFPFEEELPEDFGKRMEDYMLKAMKEAKVHTSWTIPDEDFEKALVAFTHKLLDPAHGFLTEFTPFARKIAHYGVFNSLSQTLIKITSPGVPDFYQGTELWDLSLVDPDNRRPVDYAVREQYLQEIQSAEKSDLLRTIQPMLARPADGRIKLFTVYRALQVRNQLSAVFKDGAYIPLPVTGAKAKHVVAYARVAGEQAVITVAPRFFTSLAGENEVPTGERVWQDTVIALPDNLRGFSWKNAFTDQSVSGGESLLVAEVLAHFPVGLVVTPV